MSPNSIVCRHENNTSVENVRATSKMLITINSPGGVQVWYGMRLTHAHTSLQRLRQKKLDTF